jgi:hypothetical protein
VLPGEAREQPVKPYLSYGAVVVVVVAVDVVVEVVDGVAASVVVSRTKPHFLPLVFGAAFIGFFFAFLVLQGLLLSFGIPP